MIKRFRFIKDTLHGWLEVNLTDLEELGLTKDDFSQFSYEEGNCCYLEKDVDAKLFTVAYEKRFQRPPKISESDHGPFSRVRNFRRISWTSRKQVAVENESDEYFRQIRANLLEGKWPPQKIKNVGGFAHFDEQTAKQFAGSMNVDPLTFNHNIELFNSKLVKLEDRELTILFECLQLMQDLSEVELYALSSVGYHIAKKAQNRFKMLLKDTPRPQPKKLFFGKNYGQPEQQRHYDAIEHAATCVVRSGIEIFNGAKLFQFYWHVPKEGIDLLSDYLQENIIDLVADHTFQSSAIDEKTKDKIRKYDFKVRGIKEIRSCVVFGTDYRRYDMNLLYSFRNVPKFLSIYTLIKTFNLWDHNNIPNFIQTAYSYYLVKNVYENRNLPPLTQ